MQEVVGYIRVSTPRQAKEGGSLEEQAHMLRGYCNEKNLKLATIEEDACSAAGAQGHLRRAGLRRAIKTAKEKGADLLVPSIDRLTRHPAILPEIIDSNISVISVANRRRLGKNALRQLAERAQRERDLISSRVREGAERAKARGVKLGNTTNLDVAQRKGAISNMVKADRKVRELVDFIERTPGWDQMTFSKRVELLNASGPLNLISEKRDERRPWTTSSIRKPLKKAEAELEMRRDLDKEEMAHAGNSSRGSPQGENNEVAHVNTGSDTEDDVPVSIAYKDHPGFGHF